MKYTRARNGAIFFVAQIATDIESVTENFGHKRRWFNGKETFKL